VDGAFDAGLAGGPGEVEDVWVAFAAGLAVTEVDGGDGEGGGFDDAGGGVSDEKAALEEAFPEVLLGEVHGEGGFGFAVGAEDALVAGVVVGADGGELEVGVLKGAEEEFGAVLFEVFI